MFNLSDLMVRQMVFVRQDCRIGQAAKLLCACNQTILPILNQCSEIVGILTEKDILKWLCNLRDKNAEVLMCMRTKFVCIATNTGLIDLVRLFAEKNYRHVLVVSDGVLMGVVNRTDLIKYLLSIGMTDEKTAVGINEKKTATKCMQGGFDTKL